MRPPASRTSYPVVVSDLSKISVVLSVLTPDALDSAKSLLGLAELARDEVELSSAASAAVVAAIAHLARATDVLLLSAVGNREARDGGSTPLNTLERRLPSSLRGKLHQLTIEVLGRSVEFDDKRPMAGLLVGAIRLRNKLIHHGGFVRMGTALELGAKSEDGAVVYTFRDPRFEWREVSLEYAREVVEAVEAFLENVMVEPQEGAPLDRRFFSPVRVRRGAAARTRNHPATRS